MEIGRTSEGGASPDLGGSVSAKTASCVEFSLQFFYLIQGDDATRNEWLYRLITLFNSVCYYPMAGSENGLFLGAKCHQKSRPTNRPFPQKRGSRTASLGQQFFSMAPS